MTSLGEEGEHGGNGDSTPCLPITLKFKDISVHVKLGAGGGGGGFRRLLGQKPARNEEQEERTILNGITGMVSPGEMMAILGPSGSGKSTLLSVLAGRLHGRHGGAVLVNGKEMTKSVTRRTGFVTQDDVLYPHLTVRETLVFCALLRLPRTVARAEKVRAAEAVMAELGLDKCADTVIGNAFVRGVSGGERKRVSIGHEMLTRPSMLLLDEPTSGLDATAAYRLIAMLGGLARRGRTVAASVHQPSSRVFQLFDTVLLLSEGSCLYFGRAKDAVGYFESIGYAPKFLVNPADFMLDLANGIAQVDYQGDAEKSNVKQALVSSYNLIVAPNVRKLIEDEEHGDALQTVNQRGMEKEFKNYASIGWFSQFIILLHRSLKERRYESFNSLRVFQVLAAALLAGSMWWRSNIHNVHDRLGLLFFMSIFWGVFPSFNAVFVFPQDRAIFMKERRSGMYTLSPYFMARLAGDLPMELLLPTVFTIVAYWMTGLRPDLETFVLTLIVILGYVLVAQGLGLALGAIIMDAKQASTMITVIMLAFLLTGGFYVLNVPFCMAWLKYVSYTFYCYRLLVGVQYNGMETEHLDQIHKGRGSVEQELEGPVSESVCIIVMVSMFIGYRLMAYAALRRIKV
ncbi:Sulfate-transporting ATPase protein [Dioscorea alata]|uniref:Sulfate-transporting ATPase protein n=1 Tax=Dioscorea alata TaxID=55571 RepID=A0ACB7WC74_DIOAL|nr:Sulfate-transporting ATPase protein [Dioscorea alata]